MHDNTKKVNGQKSKRKEYKSPKLIKYNGIKIVKGY